MKLPPSLKGCRGAVVDTMVLIYLFENHPRWSPVCEWLMERAEASDYTGVITPVTAAEILVKPIRAGRSDLADRYRLAIGSIPNIHPCEFTWKTGGMAGALRAKYGLPLPDMFQAACAMEHGGVLITNDSALKKLSDIQVVLLEALT
ncbi:MAG: PIN domain-containing protein [Lentisphaerae bacterium]|nr:PIN domain-containing protein [Lentisphaerota bacterium]